MKLVSSILVQFEESNANMDRAFIIVFYFYVLKNFITKIKKWQDRDKVQFSGGKTLTLIKMTYKQ